MKGNEMCSISNIYQLNGRVPIGKAIIGLFAKYWRKIITPVVAASVVTAIGFSLFTVVTRSFGGGYAEDFGSMSNLLLGTITLATGVHYLSGICG